MAVNKVIYNNDGIPNVLIDLTGDTATASDVAQGKTFHLASGVQATGTGSGGGGISLPGDIANFRYYNFSNTQYIAEGRKANYASYWNVNMTKYVDANSTVYVPSDSLNVGNQLTFTKAITTGASPSYIFSNVGTKNQQTTWSSIKNYYLKDYFFYCTEVSILNVFELNAPPLASLGKVYVADADTGEILVSGATGSSIILNNCNNRMFVIAVSPYDSTSVGGEDKARFYLYSNKI